MSPESQHYLKLFEKEASALGKDTVDAVSYVADSVLLSRQPRVKVARVSPAVALLAGAVPAYYMGRSTGAEEAKERTRMPYMLTGAAAGLAIPKLIGALTSGVAGGGSTSGFSAADVDALRELTPLLTGED